MNDIVIRVQHLSKLYRLGQHVISYSLREKATEMLSYPFRHLGRKSDDAQKNAFKNNDYIWALRDVSFEVKKGEVIGIIGRNGAGKSTLLKILTRITDPTEGSAEMYGKIGSLLEIGSGFHPELTGSENIFMNGAILGMRKNEIERKFAEIVDFSGVEKFIDTPLKRYSSGMQVRLAFSVAAHLEPEILLVDEVLAVGDMAFQRKCLGKMQDVSQQGRTVLFVSHNMQAIRALCPRSILLKDGIITGDGQTNDIIMGYYNDLRLLTVDANTAISDPKTRRGSGAARFTRISIQDESGNECSHFTMGSNIRFALSYQTYEPVDNLNVSITLRSGRTGGIVTTVTYQITEENLPAGHSGSIIIEFPKVKLRPGEYPLYMTLSNRNLTYFDVVDDLTIPLIISVDKDYEELGFDPTRDQGVFSIESKLIR
jgi:lipopolysaccharide transport system ATP-binding protein